MEKIAKDYLDPILVVDDEHNNVALLLEALRKIGHRTYDELKLGPRLESNGVDHLKYTFTHEVSCPGEAISLMKELQEEKIRFGAIVSDNHMKGEDGEAISGDDFLRLLSGQLAYCLSKDEDDLDLDCRGFRTIEDLSEYVCKRDEDFCDFFNDYFDNMTQYGAFVDYWNPNKNNTPKLVMLCGSPREADLRGLDDIVSIVQKTWDLEGITCERHVLDILSGQGVLPREQTAAIINSNPRLGSKTSARKRYYHPPRS